MNESLKYKPAEFVGNSHELSLRYDPTLPKEEDTIIATIKATDSFKINVEDTLYGFNNKLYVRCKCNQRDGYVLREAVRLKDGNSN